MRPSQLKERVTGFLREIEARHMRISFRPPMLLHYHSPRGELIEWAWPMDAETLERLRPDQLQDHGRTHHFRAPSCLCAFIDGEAYSETAIAVVESLPSVHADPDRNLDIVNGEYIATCARNRCGYFACFERFFSVKEIKVQIYPERDQSSEGVSRIAVINDSSRREEGGLFQVVPDIGSMCPRTRERCLDIEEVSVAVEQNTSLQNDLMMGVKEERFWSLFVQCHLCKTVMLRKPFGTLHSCVQPRGRRFSLQKAWRPAQELSLPRRIPLPVKRRTVFRVGAPQSSNQATRLPVVEGTDTEIDSANDADSDIPAAAPSSDGPSMLDILNDVISQRSNATEGA